MSAVLSRSASASCCTFSRNTRASLARPRPAVHRGLAARSASRTGSVVVRASFDGPQGPPNPVETFFKRYDFTSAMMGALVVTGFFWSTGQNPIEALGITACSTVFAVVANELLFNNEK